MKELNGDASPMVYAFEIDIFNLDFILFLLKKNLLPMLDKSQ